VDECASQPCWNGGTCRDLIGRYQCSCPRGTSGLRCETDVDECASSPCQHAGTCRDLVGAYHCDCAPGFTGRQCEADVNECLSRPCSGPGSRGCVQRGPGDGYRCVCEDGWTGSSCETRMPRCPCLNGGRCRRHESPASALCDCPQVQLRYTVIYTHPHAQSSNK